MITQGPQPVEASGQMDVTQTIDIPTMPANPLLLNKQLYPQQEDPNFGTARIPMNQYKQLQFRLFAMTLEQKRQQLRDELQRLREVEAHNQPRAFQNREQRQIVLRQP